MDRSADPCPRTTGAASGFGRGIAEHYAEEGAKVLVCDINCEAGEKLTETSDAFAFQEMNVTKADDWKAAIDKAVQLWGKVDILVNNAGTSYTNKVNHSITFPTRGFSITAACRAPTK